MATKKFRVIVNLIILSLIILLGVVFIGSVLILVFQIILIYFIILFIPLWIFIIIIEKELLWTLIFLIKEEPYKKLSKNWGKHEQILADYLKNLNSD
ncbi:MAG: hypothetical protein ACTSRZ_11755 [Promethearchaeota archaeon]